MLSERRGAAWFVRVADASVRIQDRMLGEARQDLASGADREGFAIHAVAPTAASAAMAAPARSVSRERREENPCNHENEAGSTRIDPVREGSTQLVEGGLADKIREGPEALGLQGADIHGERREGLGKGLSLSRSRHEKACAGKAGTGNAHEK